MYDSNVLQHSQQVETLILCSLTACAPHTTYKPQDLTEFRAHTHTAYHTHHTLPLHSDRHSSNGAHNLSHHACRQSEASIDIIRSPHAPTPSPHTGEFTQARHSWTRVASLAIEVSQLSASCADAGLATPPCAPPGRPFWLCPRDDSSVRAWGRRGS